MLGSVPEQRKLEKTQLRWIIHFERMEGGRLAKKRWIWRPSNTKPRGRPKNIWKYEAEELIGKHNIPSVQELRERD